MIRHLSSIAEVVGDIEASVAFYRDVLGLEVEYDSAEGYGLIKIAGSFHFGLWSRKAAAVSVFGDAAAAEGVPLGFTIGFETDDVADTERTLVDRGVTLVQGTHTEPWGQVTARFLTPSGALAEVAETPWARTAEQAAEYAATR